MLLVLVLVLVMVMVMWSRARACNTTYSPIIPLVYPGLLAAVSDEIILLIETLEKDRCEVSPGTPTRETRMHRKHVGRNLEIPHHHPPVGKGES